MKRFLLMGIACMAFLSCSKDLVLDVNRGAAIEFTVAAQTRAQELTLNNLLTFYATAVDPRQDVNYFSNLPFMKSGEYYVSSPAYYWPGDGAPLNIYAYAPTAAYLGVSDDSETTLKIDRGTQILANFSPAAEIADQQDFIAAVLPEFTNPGDGNAVQLAFEHQLVQIEIKAKNSNPGEIYHVKGVKIAQVKSKGDFDFSDQSWTLDDEARADYVVEYDDARILDPYGVNLMNTAGDNIIESYSDNAMLLPQELVSWDPQGDQQNHKKGAYIAVLMKITSSSGASVTPTDQNSGYQWVAAPFPTGTEWEAGNKYIYTLDFTNGASYSDPSTPGGGELLVNEITFDVDIVGWDHYDSYDHPLVGEWNLKDFQYSVSQNQYRIDAYFHTVEDIRDLGQLMPGSESVTFETSKMYYFNGDPNPRFITSANGNLYFDIENDIKVSEYTDSELKVSILAVSEDDNGNVSSEEFIYTYTKVKDGQITEPYQPESWEKDIVGLWTAVGGNEIFTPDDPSLEVMVGEPDFYATTKFRQLNFTSPSLFYFYGIDSADFIWIVDDKPAIYATVTENGIDALFIEEITSTTMLVHGMCRGVNYGVNGTYEYTYYYVKGAPEDPVEKLLGDWYFHDAMVVTSIDGKIQERRWFNSYELALTLHYAVSSVNIETTSSAVINIEGEPVSAEIVNNDGVLYFTSEHMPDNMSVCIPEYSESYIKVEISFTDPSDNKLYRYVQTFTRERSADSENWRQNLCGVWDFDRIEITNIYDDGTVTHPEFDQEFHPGFYQLYFPDETQCYLRGTGENNGPHVLEIKAGEGLVMTIEGLPVKYYISEIKPESMHFSLSARTFVDGVEVYQEMVAYYTKNDVNE